MHTAHGIGHTVGSGAGCHIVRVKGTAGTAAGCNREVRLAGSNSFLLVGTCNGVLETGRVRGVSGDGNIDVFLPHDGNAFGDVVCAVAVDLGAGTVGVSDALYFLDLALLVVHLGLNEGEAVDTGDDLCSVLA